MIDRMIRVARLDASVFAEVENDPAALSQAAMVVAIVAVASAIGSLSLGVGAMVVALVGAFISWIIWSYLTYLIGTSVFKAQATPGEMLRTLGFALAPQVLSIFGLIPCIGWLAAIVGWIISLIAGFLAAREALDLDTSQTLITIFLSWLISFLVYAVIASIFGGLAAITGTATASL